MADHEDPRHDYPSLGAENPVLPDLNDPRYGYLPEDWRRMIFDDGHFGTCNVRRPGDDPFQCRQCRQYFRMFIPADILGPERDPTLGCDHRWYLYGENDVPRCTRCGMDYYAYQPEPVMHLHQWDGPVYTSGEMVSESCSICGLLEVEDRTWGP